MSAETNKTVVRRYLEEGSRNSAVFDEVLAPNCDIYFSGLPAPVQGIPAMKQTQATYRAAFPDLTLKVDDLLAEGDTVVARYTMRGTQKGQFQNIPPSGKSITISGVEFLHLKDGKIVRGRGEMDLLGLLRQLGVVSVPGG